MTDLHELGHISDGNYLEFLNSHTAVLTQHSYKHTSSINPYVLGFKVFMDIKRICEKPDEEDLELFPDICNTDWLETIKDIAANYRDESFIRQFLSPKVVKDMKLFVLDDNNDRDTYVVSSTQAAKEFKKLREELADNYIWERMFFSIELAAISDEGVADIVIILEEGQEIEQDDFFLLEGDLLEYFNNVKLHTVKRTELNTLYKGSLKEYIKQLARDKLRG